jgi:hypothetical protein
MKLITANEIFHTCIGDINLIMKTFGEIEAVGKGLFKFNRNFKAYQGETLEMIANPTNKAGRFNLALRILVFLMLSFTLLKTIFYRSFFPQTATVSSS